MRCLLARSLPPSLPLPSLSRARSFLILPGPTFPPSPPCLTGNRDVEWVGSSSKRFAGRVVRPVVKMESLSVDEGDAPPELHFSGLPMRRVRHPCFDTQLGALQRIWVYAQIGNVTLCW